MNIKRSHLPVVVNGHLSKVLSSKCVRPHPFPRRRRPQPPPYGDAAARSMRADALVEAGDSASAAAAFEAIRVGAEGRRRAVATVELGRLRLAAGDRTEARQLL